jgi:hypothetical protein
MKNSNGCATRNVPSGRVLLTAVIVSIMPLAIAVFAGRILGWSSMPTAAILAGGPLFAWAVIARIVRLGWPLTASAIFLSLTILVPSLLSEMLANKMFVFSTMAGWYICYLGTWELSQSRKRLMATTLIISAIMFGAALISL